MTIKSLFYIPLILIMPVFAEAGATWAIGTPANAGSLTPLMPTPTPDFGGEGILINFDSLTAFTTYSTTFTSGPVSIVSPDGFEVYPFSDQSAPNYLYDTSADGSANITITTTKGEYGFGIGIADSDFNDDGSAVTIDLQPLNSTGGNLGAVNAVTISESDPFDGNGYFYVEDTTNDIYGIQITQPVGSDNFSGLAIDDVQVLVSPEPSTFLLLFGGALAMIGSTRLRRKA